MIEEIKIPFINANDKEVKIIEVFAKNGQHLKKGERIYSVETTKALVEIEALFDGFVWLKNIINKSYSIDTLIGVITDYENFDLNKYLSQIRTQENGLKQSIFTKKALLLAEKNKIDINTINSDGKKIITEKDILNYIIAVNETKENCFSFKGNINVIRLKENDFKIKIFDISNEEWINLYSKNGAYIHSSTKCGNNVLLIAKEIIIEEGCHLGSNIIINADKIRIGKYSKIGNNVNIETGFLELGNSSVLADNVKIDLSGGKNADSIFRTGSNCLIASEVYLNNCRKIELENFVALSPRSMIFTHSFWQSVLDGYYANFGPVMIRNNSWLGASAQVLPNIIIEEGVIIMSGSVVTENIPAFVFAGGIPAKKIKQNIKKNLSLSQKIEMILSLLEDFTKYCTDNGLFCDKLSAQDYSIHIKNMKYLILVRNNINDKNNINDIYDHVIVLFVSGETKQEISKSTYFDFSKNEIIGDNIPIVSELRNYLRRRGIIFSPYNWNFVLGTDSIQQKE